MDRNYVLFGLLILQILLFAAVLISNKWDRKPVHYFVLALLSTITLTHIFAYNTDCEDIYISLRYVKNFVEGNGLVFNTFDKVEGYSDFLWVMMIAGVYKILHADIPLISRCMSVVFSVITLLYTYYLAFKFTQDRLLSYLATFLVSISCSFACYGLSGLENPLYALFILLIVNCCYEQKWILSGVFLGLMTMTRPEGFIMFVPIAVYIFLLEREFKYKLLAAFIVAVIAAIPVIPWTIWRVSYYGYLVPNTIAAKQGMDLFYQVRIGLTYTAYFFIIISESLLVLVLLPIINYIYTRRNSHSESSDKVFITLLTTSVIFIAFYSYAGGDWMPAWRFYASLIPVFSILIILLWSKYVFISESNSVLRSSWIVLLFAFCGYAQVRNSFMNANLIPLVRSWYYEVEGLKVAGKWFHNTLPKNTLLATFPNGAFSYYNDLPTIDYGGLTDNNVGRFGKKRKEGRPGHIAENPEYVLSRKPDIIAIMDGQGLVKYVNNKPIFQGYDPVTFAFSNYTNPLGEYVNINIRADRTQEIVGYLLRDKNVKLIKQMP
jgi:hypothetical protein